MPTVRRVNIRRFQQSLFKELQELPVIITRKKKDAFLIIACEEEKKENGN
jgi:hypothetical protein